jgi:hypothetical protein
VQAQSNVSSHTADSDILLIHLYSSYLPEECFEVTLSDGFIRGQKFSSVVF